MSTSTDSTEIPSLPELIQRLSTPATCIEEAWAVAAELKRLGLGLIAQGRPEDAIELGRVLSRTHELDPWVCDMCADVLQWATWQQWDPFVAQQALTLAERGEFAFSFRVEHEMRGRRRTPFFMSAFMPKSGGTYISATLRRTYDLQTDLPCVFGTDGDVLLSRARVSVFMVVGGVYNHSHLTPSAWNFAVLRDLRVPVWVHIRDPRDTFLSLLNMSHLEAGRTGPDAETFQSRIQEEAGGTSVHAVDEMAERLFPMFEYQCTWAKGWLDFDYPNKVLTRHDQLLRDEATFFATAARDLRLPDAAFSYPPRDYQETRFFRGTNGRWQTAFSAALGERMTGHMRATGLLDAFP